MRQEALDPSNCSHLLPTIGIFLFGFGVKFISQDFDIFSPLV